jgi:hypothetical protein
MASEWIGPFSIIISNGALKNSSDVFYILDPDVGGAKTFSIKLSANGLEPVTHWGCRTPLKQEMYDALTVMSNAQFMTYINNLAALRGRPVVGSVTAFKNSMQISEMEFDPFIATLGLQEIVMEV